MDMKMEVNMELEASMTAGGTTAAVAAGGPNARFDVALGSSEGSPRVRAPCSCVPTVDAGRDDARIAALEQRIAELAAANEALAMTATTLKMFVAQVPAAVAMLDRDMRYLATSRKWAADYGLTETDLAGRLHHDFFSGSSARWREVEQRAMAGEVVAAAEDRWDRPDGSVQWFCWEVWPWHTSEGAVGGIFMSSEDITADEQLRRYRDGFSRLVQDDPFGMLVVDADFRLQQVSRGAEPRLTWAQPWRGRDFAEVLRILWPESVASEAIERFRDTLATGTPFAALCTARRADIDVLETYDWRIERVELPDGRFGIVCNFYDLTERQHAETARRERESFYEQTLESIPGMVFTASPDGAYEYVNEQWVELTGVPAAELLGDDWLRVLHPEDRTRTLAAWRVAVQDRREHVHEHRIRRADGVYEWFKVHAHAIRDAAGAVVRWLGVAVTVDDLKRAVDDLKRAEAALVARERELRTLADNTPDILSRFDRDLRHVFINAAVEAATGRTREDFLGRTYRELEMPADLCNLWEATIRAVFEERQPRSIEYALDAPSGLRCYATRFVPEPGSDGGIEHVLAVTHDVSDLKQAQDALEDADRHKDQFLAALAHELRNPLAPIRTGLAILRKRGAAGELEAKAQVVMERQLSHLVRLVDDLLDVARISRGKVELKPQRVEVRTILEHAMETARPLIDASEHALAMRIPNAPIWVDGDLTRLAQVVGNLLNNAAKYTPSRGHIELRAEVEDGDQVVIRVTDDGVGIGPDMLGRVFDLFVQVDDSLHRAQGGLGIGLSLVRKLVELHGGSIAAESRGLGRGSTFTVRLPLAPVVTDAAGIASPPLDAPIRSSGRRVLVVDDNADGAETLAMLLEISGHETMIAGDGAAALAIIRTQQPEVVFLDIGLPEMDGYEVARRIRADPTTAGMMLVAVTGWGSEDDKRKSRDAGFDIHLTKPVGAEVVADVLERCFTLRRTG
jgi:PAS domain S-box-containing protein